MDALLLGFPFLDLVTNLFAMQETPPNWEAGFPERSSIQAGSAKFLSIKINLCKLTKKLQMGLR